MGKVTVHPTEFIQAELDARGWGLDELAIEMGGIACFGINRLALDLYFAVGPGDSNCRLGEEMAEGLAEAFGVSKNFFIHLENSWVEGIKARDLHNKITED